jgi:hypothetical protein
MLAAMLAGFECNSVPIRRVIVRPADYPLCKTKRCWSVARGSDAGRFACNSLVIMCAIVIPAVYPLCKKKRASDAGRDAGRFAV